MTQKVAHAVRNRFGNKMSPFDLNCHLNQRCYVSKMRHFLINKTFTLSLQTILVVSFSNFLFSSLSKVFLFYKKKECRILFHLVVFFILGGGGCYFISF